MRITAKKLREVDACVQDIAKFEKEWPGGCNVTKKNCLKAFCELGLIAEWAAEEFLSETDYSKYLRATMTTWDKYMDEGGVAWDKHVEACAIAFWRAAK